MFLLPLLICAGLGCVRAQDACMGKDGAGNLVLNATEGQRVMVNGVDVVAALKAAQAQIDSQSTLLAETTALLARLQAGMNSAPFGGFNKVYAAGGAAGLNPSTNTVSVYDGKEWAFAPSMLLQRSAACAAAINSTLFVAGGRSAALLLREVEAFDGRAWRAAPAMEWMRADLACVAFQGSLFALGGITLTEGREAFTPTVERFDGTAWVSERSMNLPRGQHAAAVFRGRLYVAGGYTGDMIVGSVEYFFGGNWTPAGPMFTGRIFFGLAVFNNLLYAVGGRSNTQSLEASTERSDGQTWVKTQSPLTTAALGTVMTFNNALLWVSASTVEVFTGTSWAVVSSPPTPARSFMCAAVLPLA
jgi:hypothetical protein